MISATTFSPMCRRRLLSSASTPRTVRRAAAAGDIPACRIGAKWLIPLTWLQEQAGATADLEAFIDSRVQGPAS